MYAPELTNLRIDDTVVVGDTLTASVHASDEDGLADITFHVKFTLGGSSADANTKLDNIPAGVTASDITLTFPFQNVGEHQLDIMAEDIDGNHSNTLTAVVTSLAAAADE